MDDREFSHGRFFKERIPNFTGKGCTLKVVLGSGKQVLGRVVRCVGNYADVSINGKTYLVNNAGKLV